MVNSSGQGSVSNPFRLEPSEGYSDGLCPTISSWLTPLQKKKKRLFHRAISFIEFHRARHHRVRYLVLTSKLGSMSRQDMAHYWDILVKRIRQTFHCPFEFIKGFEFGMENNMLHLNVLASDSPYIPQDWLSKAWLSITGSSSIVWICEVKRRESHKQIAGYLPKYLSKDPKFRYSRSRRSLPIHFAETWHDFRCAFGLDVLYYWNMWLRSKNPQYWRFINRWSLGPSLSQAVLGSG